MGTLHINRKKLISLARDITTSRTIDNRTLLLSNFKKQTFNLKKQHFTQAKITRHSTMDHNMDNDIMDNTMEGDIMNIVDEVKENMTSDAYNKISKAIQKAHFEKVQYVKLHYALIEVDMGDVNDIIDKPRIGMNVFNTHVKLSKRPCLGQETGQFHFKGILTENMCMMWKMEIQHQGVARCNFEHEGVMYIALILDIRKA